MSKSPDWSRDLLQTILEVHTGNTGSLEEFDPDGRLHAERVEFLKSRLENWEPGQPDAHLFDEAVRGLLEACLHEEENRHAEKDAPHAAITPETLGRRKGWSQTKEFYVDLGDVGRARVEPVLPFVSWADWKVRVYRKQGRVEYYSFPTLAYAVAFVEGLK